MRPGDPARVKIFGAVRSATGEALVLAARLSEGGVSLRVCRAEGPVLVPLRWEALGLTEPAQGNLEETGALSVGFESLAGREATTQGAECPWVPGCEA